MTIREKIAEIAKNAKTQVDLDALVSRGALRQIREEFPDIHIRIDFHKRFTKDSFLEVFDAIRQIDPDWIEEPCELGATYAEIRESTQTPLAAGELYFGRETFVEIMANEWVDVIMPDVKHDPQVVLLLIRPSIIVPNGPVVHLFPGLMEQPGEMPRVQEKTPSNRRSRRRTQAD